MPIFKQHFNNTQDWANATASKITSLLTKGLQHRDKTSLAVPGGRTAKAVLPILASMDFTWTHLAITLTDERWVNTNHKDSNERLVKTLLPNASIIGLKTNHPTPEKGRCEASKRIEELIPFGCILLGMGEDGHIASLFPKMTPHTTTLQTSEQSDYPRISMTPHTLLNSNALILAVSGPKKCAILEQALRPGPASELPVRHVLHQEQTPVIVMTC